MRRSPREQKQSSHTGAMQGQQNYAPQGGQGQYVQEGQQGYEQQQQGQQGYSQQQGGYKEGYEPQQTGRQEEYAPQGQQNYGQQEQGLDYPQPATLREGGVAAVHPGGVHEVPIHDTHNVGAPVHTTAPPLTTGAAKPMEVHSGTGKVRAGGANTGGESGGSGGKMAGLALGLVAFLILLFLVRTSIST